LTAWAILVVCMLTAAIIIVSQIRLVVKYVEAGRPCTAHSFDQPDFGKGSVGQPDQWSGMWREKSLRRR
jgi:hypothetical protein